MISFISNAFLGLAFTLVAPYSVSDLTAALSTPTGYPIIVIYAQALNSTAGSVVLISMIILIYVAALAAIVASASRLIWAFACDGALPFSDFLSHVSPAFFGARGLLFDLGNT